MKIALAVLAILCAVGAGFALGPAVPLLALGVVLVAIGLLV